MQATAAPPAAPEVDPPALTPASRRRFPPGDRICPGLLACARIGGDERTERWLAWSEPLWARVVVLVPRDEHADDLRTVRRLAREARTLRRLAHPAIPRLLDDRHDHPFPHLVLEHVEGRTLERALLAEGPLPPGEVARLGVRLAAGLHYAHGRGVSQLGIEAHHIALRCGQPVLLHAGAARPPRGGLDPRPDLAALGAVLYEAATGRAAPGVGGPVPRARSLRPGLPAELEGALHALLERDAGRRPRTALDALRRLAAALPPGEASWPAFAGRLLDTG